MGRLLGAFAFLTVIGRRGAPAGESALLFPLVGALIGCAGAVCHSFADPLFGSSIGGLITLIFWSALTGARPENGVLRSIGAVTLAFVLLMRWQALGRLPSNPVWDLAACCALARGSMAVAAYCTPPLTRAISDTLTLRAAAGAAALSAAMAFWPGPTQGVVLLTGAVLTTAFLVRWFTTQAAGIDIDGLHACGLLTETVLLLLSTCRNCPWWSWWPA